MSTIILLFLIAFITILAYWRHDRVWYILSGFALIIYGFNYWDTSNYMSIILVVGGFYNFAKAKWEKA